MRVEVRAPNGGVAEMIVTAEERVSKHQLLGSVGQQELVAWHAGRVAEVLEGRVEVREGEWLATIETGAEEPEEPPARARRGGERWVLRDRIARRAEASPCVSPSPPRVSAPVERVRLERCEEEARRPVSLRVGETQHAALLALIDGVASAEGVDKGLVARALVARILAEGERGAAGVVRVYTGEGGRISPPPTPVYAPVYAPA